MKRVLVVEDERHLADGLRFNLEAEGYQVEVAETGEAALELLAKGSPAFDVVVLDVMLPGMDGFEICHRLRSEPDTAQLLILMFSAKAQEIDKNTGLKVGADDYLPKPAAPAEIVSRVAKLLEKKKSITTAEEKVSG